MSGIPAEARVCTACDGQGGREYRHPWHGSRFCPEPTVFEPCTGCGGDGLIRGAR